MDEEIKKEIENLKKRVYSLEEERRREKRRKLIVIIVVLVSTVVFSLLYFYIMSNALGQIMNVID